MQDVWNWHISHVLEDSVLCELANNLFADRENYLLYRLYEPVLFKSFQNNFESIYIHLHFVAFVF